MNIIIKSGLVFLITLLIENPASGQWTTDSLITKNNLNSISFFEDGSGWIVGNNGAMLYKHGNSWELSEKVTDADLYSVFLNSRFEGWAVGSGGTILYYNGTNWTAVDSPTREGLFSVSFKNSDNGVAVGIHGTVITYNNGRWQSENRIGRDNLYCAEFNDDFLLMGGGAEASTMPIVKIKEKSDNKNEETFDPGYVFIKDIFSLNSDNIWAVGMPGIIYHNNGVNWKRFKTADNIPSLNSVCFSDENHGVAVGYKGAAVVYSDNKWKREETPSNIKLNGIAFTGDTYYAVGNRGTILTFRKKSDALNDRNNLSSIRIPVKNYPNPTGDMLYYAIPEEFNGRSVRVIITNSVGQILFTRDLHDVSSDYDLNYCTADLSNGSYIIRIESSGLTGTGKFIVKH